MSRSKKSQGHKQERSRRESGSAADRRGGGGDGALRLWYRGKRPIVRFVGLFALFMSLAYLCEIIPAVRSHVFPAYLRHNARVCGVILGVLGENVSVSGKSIASPRFALEVAHGCNALLPTALFVSAALASPVSIWAKIPGILIGSIVLMLMNLARIVSMFYAGIYVPSFFDTMHAEVWPAIFIGLSLFLWVVWAVWARDRYSGLAHDTG